MKTNLKQGIQRVARLGLASLLVGASLTGSIKTCNTNQAVALKSVETTNEYNPENTRITNETKPKRSYQLGDFKEFSLNLYEYPKPKEEQVPYVQFASFQRPREEPKKLETKVAKQETEEEARIRVERYTEEDKRLMIETLYSEGREMYKTPEYLRDIGVTILARAIEDKKSVKKVVTEKNQYTRVPNAREKSRKDPIESKAYSVCESVATTLLEEGFKKEEEKNHYFVDTVKTPYWARGETPLKTYQHGKHKTRFYYLPKQNIKKS